MSKVYFCIVSAVRIFYSTHPGVIVAKQNDGYNKWSDLALAKKHGRLSAIEVEVQNDGWHIQTIRARCFPPQSLTLYPGTEMTIGLCREKQENRHGTQDHLASWFSWFFLIHYLLPIRCDFDALQREQCIFWE